MPWVVKYGVSEGDAQRTGKGVFVTAQLQEAINQVERLSGPEVEVGRRVWAQMQWVDPE